MKDNNKLGTIWVKRLRVAVATAALAATAVFGATAVEAPAPADADEQAGVTWSFSVVYDDGVGDDDDGRFGGYLMGATWS